MEERENNLSDLERGEVPAAEPTRETAENITEAHAETDTVTKELDAPPEQVLDASLTSPCEAPATEPTDLPAEAQADDGQEESEAALPIALDWRFGRREEDAPVQQKGASKRFFGVFCGVVAACLAILIVTLFLGDAGIHIVRTLAYDRTVFVRENDTGEIGLLAPEEAAELVKRSTVTVSVRTALGAGIGSGFIYREDGYICTNQHVVEDATSVQVIFADGTAMDATVVGTDVMSDLAVLKVDKNGLTPLKLGTSAAALVGETVVAVGTPAKIDYAGTATFGKISAINRIVSLTDDSGVVNKKMTLLQTDTSVNPGNSGGPLANMYGEVIGIVVMKVSYFGGTVYDGIGFAIPIDGAKLILDAIIEDGACTGKNPVATGRSLLGIGGIGVVGEYWYSDPASSDRAVSKEEVEGYTYIPYDGVYVISINEANAQGKLQVGDIITQINGLNMYTVYDVIDHVNRYPVNATVTLTVQRPTVTGYRLLTVDIVLLEERS